MPTEIAIPTDKKNVVLTNEISADSLPLSELSTVLNFYFLMGKKDPPFLGVTLQEAVILTTQDGNEYVLTREQALTVIKEGLQTLVCGGSGII